MQTPLYRTCERPTQALHQHLVCGNYALWARHDEAADNVIGVRMPSHTDKWSHPGGKLRELGAHNLDDSELIAILISTGTKGRPAEVIAHDLLEQFGSLAGLANQPLEGLLAIKGLGDVKILRIAAALEIARRAANEIIRERERQAKQNS